MQGGFQAIQEGCTDDFGRMQRNAERIAGNTGEV